MSLLMQALKKAERAKLNAGLEDETDKPSQAFDALLDLVPVPAPASTNAGLQLDLEPLSGLSLEPLQTIAPSGLTLEPAPETAPEPAPAPVPVTETPVLSGSAIPAPDQRAYAAHIEPKIEPKTEVQAEPQPKLHAQAKTGFEYEPNATMPPLRGAARARAAAAATASLEPAGLDRERLRLYGWAALLLLVVAGMGYYYWQAIAAPGAGARLPPVPMPPLAATGATGANTVGVIVAPDAAPDEQAPIAPPPQSRGVSEELERRLSATEQALANSQQLIQQQLAQLNAPRQEQLAPISAPENSEIRVARATAPAVLAPALASAYQALNKGDLAQAQQLYEAALRDTPNNRDALLGLATLAGRKGQGEQAAGYYLRLLELDPNDASAVAGLVGVRQGDSAQSEARLRAILNTNPEAGPVLFALGNLQAQQGRWSDAQQSYFRAYSATPDNPDYAYNLAIGLDRLNQPKLALKYYQRALVLAQEHAAGFDRGALRQRLHELSAPAQLP